MKDVKGVGRILKRMLAYFFILGAILAAALILYAFRRGDTKPEYTTFSSGNNGVKALYLLTAQMGYDVKRYESTSRFLPDKVTLVAVKPDMNVFNASAERRYLKEWLSRGNVMIIIDTAGELSQYRLKEFSGLEPTFMEEEAGDRVYSVGKGSLIFLNNVESYTNQGLHGYRAGIRFIRILDGLKNNEVLFDEYYHGFGQSGLTLWDLLGATGRLVVLQMVLGIMVLMLSKAGRLGKPVTVLELVKRRENENLYALSNLYVKAKANGTVLQILLDDFKRDLSKLLGCDSSAGDSELTGAVSENKGLSKMRVGEILEECGDYIRRGSKDTRLLFKLAGKLDRTRKGIK
ncbi:MAG: DUF4350 domain-containing protein [Clostridiales bacterium]|jgi:hypothetical protein|nr:DUF4350 domain-containing protein [Eubacteriales bacterium]MDH7565384.1 DUF4350 domain-containing protein [Clostridiales bacterium]